MQEALSQLWDAALNFQSKQMPAGKLSASQHVEHINKGVYAFLQYLKMDKSQITAQFGTSKRASNSFAELKALYDKKLQEGIKSTERFNPEHAAEIDLNQEIAKGKVWLNELIVAFGNWSDEDLNQYQ